MEPKTGNEPPATAAIPWRTRLVVSLISTMSDAARRADDTINRRLLSFFDLKAPPSPTVPIRSVISADTMVDSSRSLWFRVYTPTDTPDQPLPVVIFFHGGGFSYLSAATKSYDIVCRRLARRIPAVVVSVEYRLTPEHRFPCQYDDGFDVLKFLDMHASTPPSSSSPVLPPNADLSRCFLAGDSAGANLAHHVAVRACRSQSSFHVAKIIGLISIQPFFGGEERTQSETTFTATGSMLVSVPRSDWCWKVFLPAGENRDHYAANVSGPNAEDISELSYPATLVVVSGLDPLQDWQRRYYQWLKRSGKDATLIDYPNMFHAFYIFPELPESSQLMSQVKDFVGRVLSQHCKL